MLCNQFTLVDGYREEFYREIRLNYRLSEHNCGPPTYPTN